MNFHETWHKYHSIGRRINCVQFDFFCHFCHNMGPVCSYRVSSHLTGGLQASRWHFPLCPGEGRLRTHNPTPPYVFTAWYLSTKTISYGYCISIQHVSHSSCPSQVGVCHTSFPSLQGCNAKRHLIRLAVAVVTDLWRYTPVSCLTVSTLLLTVCSPT